MEVHFIENWARKAFNNFTICGFFDSSFKSGLWSDNEKTHFWNKTLEWVKPTKPFYLKRSRTESFIDHRDLNVRSVALRYLSLILPILLFSLSLCFHPFLFRFSFYVLSTNRLTISLSLSHLLPCLSLLFRIFHKRPFTCLSLCLSICLSLLSETTDRCVFIVWVLLNVVYLEASRSFFYPWILFKRNFRKRKKIDGATKWKVKLFKFNNNLDKGRDQKYLLFALQMIKLTQQS